MFETGSAAAAEASASPVTPQLIGIASADGITYFELLVPTTGRAPHPLVLILPDDVGAHRSSPYADALLRAGIAVLEAAATDDAAPRSALPDLVAAVTPVLMADPRLDTARLGLLGFGVGAQHALGLAPGWVAARVLLYPGCSALVQPADAAGKDPLLLLHGGQDAANPDDACAEAANRLTGSGREVRRIRYAKAGYAWDYPAHGLEQQVLLPRPDRPGRVAALPWPALANMSAAQVAGFLGAALAPADR